MRPRHDRGASARAHRWLGVRYHGDRYGGSYTHQKLSADAGWLADALSGGHDVFAYFNNDAEGHAVRDALDLRRYLRRRRGADGST